MTKYEALKLAREALVALENISTALREDDVLGSDIELMLNTIAAIHKALAQPEQERYFCQRCGKPVNLTTIHTCTPPQEVV
jgi:hypothetical protein